jgi:cysteinyl-tRNA synthetase
MRPPVARNAKALILCLVATLVYPWAARAQLVAPPSSASPLSSVKSWGYQLQKANPQTIAQSPFDLVVIDYSRNGVDAGRFRPDEVKAMQRKPDGSRRIVLAYLSIGEAEDYRFYWDPKWVEPAPFKKAWEPAAPTVSSGPLPETVRIPRLTAPGWLARENERWHGNYHIRYWYDGWQEVLFYDSKSYLARIQDAGFDGIYPDRVDAYYALETDREDAARRMIDLVADLAKVARNRQPGFLIVGQNAEELLRKPKYLATIDGVAKEDLLYGSPVEGTANDAGRIKGSSDHLMVARTANLPVFVVEYLDDAAAIASADFALKERGFIGYFGPRKLDRLVTPPIAP